EYQRSFDRVFEDFSANSRAQIEPSPEEAESDRRRSIISLDNQRERYVQLKIQNAITPRVADGYEWIQHDVKAWGCFLDSKCKE
ncbi:MAG: hypothetical protein HKP55_00580, partial [Gammaproteobacteria bacterium]|nr:hypothetical protein [Gammaproteobacteria bacterium]